jgi:MFS transporter, AAHS family, 4-hydroxybenzoate transporter
MSVSSAPASSGNVIDVPRLIAEHKFGMYQFWIIVICGIAMFSSGFNVLALGYLAPAVTAGLQLHPGGLTVVFVGMGFGTVISGFIWGPIADKIGRKVTIVIAQLCAVPFIFLISRATNVTELAWFEFFASFCLMGVVPNAMALAGEFMPKHLKVTLTVLVWTGFTIGTIAVSPFAAFFVDLYGWRSVFLFNSIMPLILAFITVVWMQESLNQLVRRGTASANARIAKALRRLYPRDEFAANASFISTEKKRQGFPVRLLFTEGRAKFTILVWIMGFANLVTLFFMNSWLTTTLHNAGLVLETAILVATVVHIGGTIGGIAISDVFDRSGKARFYALAACYLLACVFTASIGLAGNSVVWATAAVFMAGFFVYGVQNAYQAIIAVVYPTEMKSTGTSWAMGVSQTASLFGPLLGGILLSLQWSSTDLFYLIALPPLVAVISSIVVGLGHTEPKGALEEETAGPHAVAHR